MIYEELLTELRKRKAKTPKGTNKGYTALEEQLLLPKGTLQRYVKGTFGGVNGMGILRAEDLANAMGFDIVLVKRDEAGRSDPNP